jgi:tRNA(Phe) wybutosine-synthesizing methylase Tyw3
MVCRLQTAAICGYKRVGVSSFEKIPFSIMTTSEIKKHLHESIDKITDEAALPESVKTSIEESLKQADSGRTVPYDEVKKRFSKWLS